MRTSPRAGGLGIQGLQSPAAREEGLKLRYSGGFVQDINQILSKGSGIFCYPELPGQPEGKLRLSFELNPMAFLIEQAGGAASNGRGAILDHQRERVDERSPIFIGSKEEVTRGLRKSSLIAHSSDTKGRAGFSQTSPAQA